MSAILVCVALSAILTKTEEQCPNSGYSIEGQILSNLADDIAISNAVIRELQSFDNALAANAKDIELEINLNKTVFMTKDKSKPQLDVKIYGKGIKHVTEFVYF